MRDDEIAALDMAGWPLPDEFLIEIGRVADFWTTLEAQLDVYIGKLAGFNDLTDPIPFVIVKHASLPQKFDMLSALCEHLAPAHPRLEGCKSVVGRLKAAQAARNRLLHNGIVYDQATRSAKIVVGSARGKLKIATEPITSTDIRRITVQIVEAISDLHELVTGKRRQPTWFPTTNPEETDHR